MPLDLTKGAKLEPQVAETEFTCKLITIRTKKSFAEVTDALESLFGMKHSGIGREGGVHGLEFYTEMSNVCVKI